MKLSKKYIQTLYILSGFAIGQGMMFFVQSYFVYNRELEYLSFIGIVMGFFSLIHWGSDGGGVFILSRMKESGELHSNFFSFLLCRLLVGLSCYFVIMGGLLLIDVNEHILNTVFWSFLIIPVWALNVTGLIDNQGLNRIAGPFSGFPWFFCAITSLYSVGDDNVGINLLISYLVGLIILVFTQWFLLYRFSNVVNGFSLNFVGFEGVIKSVFSYWFAYFTAQGYSRFVPVVVNEIVGGQVAGAYVYAKTCANLVSQLIAFSRRVEFKDLVIYAATGKVGFIDIVDRQKLSFFISILGVLISGFICFFMYVVTYDQYYFLLSIYIFLMLTLVFFWVLVSSMGQVLLAIGEEFKYALVVSVGVGVAIILMFVFIREIGIYAVFVAELSMFLVQFVIYKNIFLKKVNADV